MTSGISLTFSIGQIALFFAVCSIAVITVSALLLEKWVDRRGNSQGDMIIGCAAVVVISGAVQLFSAIFLYFKNEIKSKWVTIQVVLLVVYIVCFSIPMAENIRGTSTSDAYYAVVFINWILLFITSGLLSNNAVPVSILFSMLGCAEILACSLVIKEYSRQTKLVGCASAALVGGVVQTGSSIFLFFKENIKRTWTYVHAVIIVLLVICFAIPMHEGYKGSQTEYYYGILGIDFVALFIVVGMFLKSMHF